MIERRTGVITLCLVAVALVGAMSARCPAQDSDEEVASPGRWGAVRDPGGVAGQFTGPGFNLTDEQKREMERLNSIAYLGATTPAPEVSGVTVHDRGLAAPGLNLYTSGHFPGAYLVDMEGRVLHEWRCDFATAWPESAHLANRVGAGYWRRAHVTGDGEIFAIFEGFGLVKLDRDSRVLWRHFGREHHDLEILPDGRILALTREAKIVPWVNSGHPVLEDFITLLDSNGNELQRVSILEAFEKTRWKRRFLLGRRLGDIMHSNTVEMLDGRLSDRVPAFREGNVLVCVRQLDAVAVIDLTSIEAVWAVFSPWKRQHQATVLENGNILLFDNLGNKGFSRIIEFDPATLDIEWTYSAQEPPGFYSRTCGSNQRLPNGNTLITESDYGRAFEVTPDGTVVWEFVNPAQLGETPRLIATLFEMIRLPADFPTDWMDEGDRSDTP